MDYIPTQFISEYIRYELRYDGIKYKSAMNPEGSNYVLFFDDSYVAEASEVYDMKNSRLVFTKRLFFEKTEKLLSDDYGLSFSCAFEKSNERESPFFSMAS